MIYEVGKFYMVPCVHGNLFWLDKVAWWPVMGPFHEDREYIGFADRHYHLDMRFLQTRAYRQLSADDRGREFAIVLHEHHSYSLSEPVLRRMKCKRRMPDYPHWRVPWLRQLERAYADTPLKPGRVCPHKGANLSTMTPDKSGCVTCPLHGLRWNAETGRLAPVEAR